MRVYQFRHVGTDAAAFTANTDLASRVGSRTHPTIKWYCLLLRITAGRVVPTEGLEPPHLAAHGPEPCASTNSATWALKLRLLLKLIQYQALSFFARSTSVVLAVNLPYSAPAFSFASHAVVAKEPRL